MKTFKILRGVIIAKMSLALIFLILNSCTDYIPDDLDSLSAEVNYVNKEFTPFLGRINYFANVVNEGNKSTRPLTYRIVNPVDADGRSAPEILNKYRVKVWKQNYTGLETSLSEIESKREYEYRPLLEIQEKNGGFIFWNTGDESNIRTAPDDGYTFDVEISNSGGVKYARGLKLKPKKRQDYQPSVYDESTGMAKVSYSYPNRTLNMIGKSMKPIRDVRVYMFKNTDKNSDRRTLTISAIDSLGVPIDITEAFKDSKFNDMIHGFNPRFVNGKVVYDVAYPIPLLNGFVTKYTNSAGNRAKILLQRNRKKSNGDVIQMEIYFEFAIYQEGNWEIQFRFNGETPDLETL